MIYYDILPDGNFTGNVGKVQEPTKVAPIRTFHELSRAVQSGDHKLYAMESQIPFLLDSLEDDLKAHSEEW
ncbi:hypothetical protein CEXT_65921 [Caerostris extrusa]|uniref:Uncharacterized protein n=1 Tax=Caerostris extrusa TaxID=172846 RepID=A0AAV4TEE7_CAEEX|nr:hypothetical protein CEXT_65921 [Caerostris extrusa]